MFTLINTLSKANSSLALFLFRLGLVPDSIIQFQANHPLSWALPLVALSQSWILLISQLLFWQLSLNHLKARVEKNPSRVLKMDYLEIRDSNLSHENGNPYVSSRGMQGLVMSVVFTSLAASFVVVRLYTRIKFLRRLEANDWMIVVALVSSPPPQSLGGLTAFEKGKAYTSSRSIHSSSWVWTLSRLQAEWGCILQTYHQKSLKDRWRYFKLTQGNNNKSGV